MAATTTVSTLLAPLCALASLDIPYRTMQPLVSVCNTAAACPELLPILMSLFPMPNIAYLFLVLPFSFSLFTQMLMNALIEMVGVMIRV